MANSRLGVRLVPESFRVLAARADVPRFVVAGLLARLPLGIEPLATLLYVKESSGSFAVASGAAAALAIGRGLVGPLQGRLAERGRPAMVLMAFALAHAATLALLIWAGALHSATVVPVAASGAAGLTFPPLSACVAAVWSKAPTELQATVFSLDAVLVELLLLAGPLIAGAAIALGSSSLALAASGVLIVVGTVLLATSPLLRAWQPAARRSSTQSAVRSPRLRAILLLDWAYVASIGALEVALAAFAAEDGSPSAAGPLIAVLAAGSIVGGILYAARPGKTSLSARYASLSVWLAGTLGAAALIDSLPGVFAAMFVAGLALAPLTSVGYQMVADAAGGSQVIEAYTWVGVISTIALALGTAIAGQVVAVAGAHAALLLAAAFAASGAMLAVILRRGLSLPPAVPPLTPTGRETV